MVTPMTPERWQKVKVLFEAALEKSPDERIRYLNDSGAEEGLREDVAHLLTNLDNAGAFFSNALRDAASPLAESERGSLQAGEVLAERFKLVRFLAKGGMGEVYEAEDLELHESVAVKMVRPELLREPRILDRFKREVHLAKMVTHPNVCRIFDLYRHHKSGESISDGLIFISMEILHGQTLAHHIRQCGRIPTEQALPLISQISAGLAAAHRAGIVHRDFKPGNVLLVPERDPGGLRAVITDFGLALRFGGSADTTSAFTAAQGGFGTPAYMAPEQIEGREVTSSADVYALGLVTFEMVTGCLPFASDTPLSMAVRRVQEPAPSPRIAAPNLNVIWEAAILRCLERDPAERFATPEEFVEALNGQGRAASVREKRVRAIVTLALTAVVTLSIAVALYMYRVGNFRRESHVGLGAAAPRRSVAVLGFKNLSGATQASWVSTALSEWFTTELGAGNKLRTISGEDIARMKHDLALSDADSYSRETLARVKKNLGVNYIVIGSYFVPDGASVQELRLDVRVQDTATGEVLASLSDTGKSAELLAIVSRTGMQIRQTLKAGTPADTQAIVQAAFPSNPEAVQLYAEGLNELRSYDVAAARDLLAKAVSVEPQFALAHSALSSAWSSLGYQVKAREESKMAMDLSDKLPPQERLFMEARYREINREAEKAAEIYHTLWTLYPDNLEYGLRLESMQAVTGKAQDALATLEKLRKAQTAWAEDPRVDLAEADAASRLSDFRRQQESSARAVAKAEAKGARGLMVRALLSEGRAFDELGEPSKGLPLYEQAKQIASALGDRGQVATALNDMGMMRQTQGDVGAATKLFEEALAIERGIGYLDNAAWTTNEMAITFRHAGKLLMARKKFEETLAIRRETNDRRGMAVALGNIANVLDDAGDIAGAKRKYEESLEIDRKSGNRLGQAISLGNIGNILYEQGDIAGAVKMLGESLVLGRQIGARPYVMWGLLASGSVQEARADLTGARKSYDEALSIARDLNRKPTVASCESAMAHLFIVEGHPEDAGSLARAAITEFQSERRTNDEADAHAVLASSLLAVGKLSEAEKEIELATSMTATSQLARSRLNITLVSAHVLIKAEKLAEAKKAVDTAFLVASKPALNVPYQLEARLARCELEATSGASKAKPCFTTLQREATRKGFLLIARRATTK
jgi:tetratricopeptide (TPR) repeat protein